MAVTVGTAPTNEKLQGSPAVTKPLIPPLPDPPLKVMVVVASGAATNVSCDESGEASSGA